MLYHNVSSLIFGSESMCCFQPFGLAENCYLYVNDAGINLTIISYYGNSVVNKFHVKIMSSKNSKPFVNCL